jgi:hypothetical protein
LIVQQAHVVLHARTHVQSRAAAMTKLSTAWSGLNCWFAAEESVLCNAVLIVNTCAHLLCMYEGRGSIPYLAIKELGFFPYIK